MMRPPIAPHEQDDLDREIRERALRQFIESQCAHDDSLRKSAIARQAWRLRFERKGR